MAHLDTRHDPHTWALVLAAGDGTRLSALTTDEQGITVPKQFCSLDGGASLLENTIRRARAVAPARRTCVVVADHHRRWWDDALSGLPSRNVVVQPQNRGTANGILLPVLDILLRDPAARIVVLPSDHHVGDEAVMARALREAVSASAPQRENLLLLGIEPEEADPELGYIVPGHGDAHTVLPVARFVEKPSREVAVQLVAEGALWNSLIFAVDANGLVDIFRETHAEVVTAMQASIGDEDGSWYLQALYDQLPVIDFSRHVLERAADRLRVRAVPRCGWTDLGTVPRIVSMLRRSQPAAAAKGRAVLSLADALRRRFPIHDPVSGGDRRWADH